LGHWLLAYHCLLKFNKTFNLIFYLKKKTLNLSPHPTPPLLKKKKKKKSFVDTFDPDTYESRSLFFVNYISSLYTLSLDVYLFWINFNLPLGWLEVVQAFLLYFPLNKCLSLSFFFFPHAYQWASIMNSEGKRMFQSLRFWNMIKLHPYKYILKIKTRFINIAIN